jgi:hypothetical protein
MGTVAIDFVALYKILMGAFYMIQNLIATFQKTGEFGFVTKHTKQMTKAKLFSTATVVRIIAV